MFTKRRVTVRAYFKHFSFRLVLVQYKFLLLLLLPPMFLPHNDITGPALLWSRWVDICT